MSSDVSGFYFLENDTSSFRPDEHLVAFLEKGEPPVYIGSVRVNG